MQALTTYGVHDQFAMKPENQESLSVVSHNWVTLVIDCPGHSVRSLHASTKLISQSVSTKVDFLLITHIDGDHSGGIEQLLWWKKFWEQQKLRLITHPEIYAHIQQKLSPVFRQDKTLSTENKLPLSEFIEFLPLDYDTELKLPGFGKIQSFERATQHCYGMDVLAVQVYDMQWKNTGNFSADTGFDTDLIEFLAEKGGPIIHEVGAYTPDSFSHTDITTLIEQTTEEVQARMFLNHIPEMKQKQIEQAIRESNSPLRLASILDNRF